MGSLLEYQTIWQLWTLLRFAAVAAAVAAAAAAASATLCAPSAEPQVREEETAAAAAAAAAAQSRRASAGRRRSIKALKDFMTPPWQTIITRSPEEQHAHRAQPRAHIYKGTAPKLHRFTATAQNICSLHDSFLFEEDGWAAQCGRSKSNRQKTQPTSLANIIQLRDKPRAVRTPRRT